MSSSQKLLAKISLPVLRAKNTISLQGKCICVFLYIYSYFSDIRNEKWCLHMAYDPQVHCSLYRYLKKKMIEMISEWYRVWGLVKYSYLDIFLTHRPPDNALQFLPAFPYPGHLLDIHNFIWTEGPAHDQWDQGPGTIRVEMTVAVKAAMICDGSNWSKGGVRTRIYRSLSGELRPHVGRAPVTKTYWWIPLKDIGWKFG